MSEPSLTEKVSDQKSLRSKMVIIGIGAVVLLVLGGLFINSLIGRMRNIAGEKYAEKVIETATGGQANVDLQSGQVTVQTDQGTFSTNAGLPADWPKDAPTYPGSTITYSAATTPTDSGSGFSLMATTPDTVKQVVDYFNRELVSQGWTIEATQNIAGTSSLASVKSNRDFSIAVISDGTTTTITQTLTSP